MRADPCANHGDRLTCLWHEASIDPKDMLHLRSDIKRYIKPCDSVLTAAESLCQASRGITTSIGGATVGA